LTGTKDYEKQKYVLKKLREAKTNFVEVQIHVAEKITTLYDKVEENRDVEETSLVTPLKLRETCNISSSLADV
jgi:ribosomal protein S25